MSHTALMMMCALVAFHRLHNVRCTLCRQVFASMPRKNEPPSGEVRRTLAVDTMHSTGLSNI